MKMKLVPCILTLGSLGILALLLMGAPPAGLSWRVFWEESSPKSAKALYLARTYLLPTGLSFAGISLLQLQFRLSASGMRKAIVFPICLVASLTTISGFRYLMVPDSAPAYALGMALGYMMTARVYAVSMRPAWRGISIPWIIWRGNKKAVSELNIKMRAMAEAASAANSPQTRFLSSELPGGST